MNSIPTFEYDDMFVFFPSILQKQGLAEGKSLGTSKQQDLLLLQHVGNLQAFDPEAFASARKRGQTVGKRQLKATQNTVRDDLMVLIARYQQGNLHEVTLRKAVKKKMKIAWRDTFLAGLRAGGLPSDPETKKVKLGPGDDKWLKSAMTHEMRFLNKFLDAIVGGTYKMSLDRRVEMYVRTLESAYDSARVIALPATALVYWVGPRDRITCPSCRYMYVNSPFTKFNLPTTPRSGATLCLCLTSCQVMVKTERGEVAFQDVREGEKVYTHRNRWRKVVRKITNKSVTQHRYAVVVGEGGRLFGVTDDHKVYTSQGWVTAYEAATENLRVMRYADNKEKQDRTLPDVFSCSCEREAYAGNARSPIQTATALFRYCLESFSKAVERSLFGALLVRHYAEVSACLPLPLGAGAGVRTDTTGVYDSPQERRLYRRPFGESGNNDSEGTRRPSRRARSERPTEEAVYAARPEESELLGREDVHAGMRSLSDRLSGIQAGFGRYTEEALQRRVSGLTQTEPKDTTLRAVQNVFRGENERDSQSREEGSHCTFLLADLLSREGENDVAVQRLRKEFQEAEGRHKEVEVGQVLLLQGVLPVETEIYDLEVDEDHSFVVEGMVIHNSNCRDRLLIRNSPMKAVQKRESEMPTRGTMISHLRKIKKTGELPLHLQVQYAHKQKPI